MSKLINSRLSFIPYILLILYVCTGLITALGAIDILGPQWVYFGSINIVTCTYFLFEKDSISLAVKNLLSTFYFWAYSLLMIWALGSYFYAINSVETLINFPRYFNVYIATIFSFIFRINLEI